MTNKFLAAFSRTTNRFFLITVVLLLSFMSLSAKTLAETLFYQSHINANIFQFPVGDFRETIVSPQNTITVSATIMTINGSDGLCTLKEAIIAANTNAVSGMTPGECVAGSSSGADTIVVPAGIYTLTTADNTETNFGTSNGLPLIVSPIIIQGAGASQTVIQRSSAAGTPEFRFFQVSVLTEVGRLTLNDLTLKNGKMTNYGAGAIFPYDVLTINNCLFENNSTGNGGAGGGAIGSSFPYTAIINNSTFTGNSSGATGGAINASDLTVTNSTFTNNTAAGGGGAISMGHNSTAAISGNVFTNNTVTGESPGGAVNGFTVNISNSIFNGNSAPFNSNNGSGGAVYARFITIDQSAFTNNAAGGSGGAIGNVPTAGAFVTITNSTFSGNTANYGGGVYGANTTISNSTVSGNFARESGGGVIFNGSESSLSLNNVTITNNTADSDLSGTGRGGGLFHTYSFGTSQLMNIRNTIIAGNINSNTPDCGTEFGHAVLSQGYNLIGNDTGCNFTSATGDLVGTSSQPINPLLGALQNNGGAGKTHALLADSPAIDNANPNTPNGTGNNCLAADQRGAPRPADGDENGTSRCDIGAFEVVELIPTRLAYSVQPTNRTAGQVFNPAIKVEIQDQFGILMPNETADISIALGSNPGGSTLSGTLTRTTVGGVAVFDDVYLNRTGTGYTLQAASGSLTVATSNAFNITPGAPTQLVFTTEPSNVVALATITPAVVISVQDSFGNLATNQSRNITISIANNAGNGTLSGNVSANTSNNGFVIFNSLSINQPGSGYTLQASVSGLPSIQSSAFEVTRPLFVVTKTADTSDGACNADCSLREAISAANAMNGADTINFNISGSAPFTITPSTALPTITDQVTIDGATQSGFTGSSPVVGINGSAIAQNAYGLSVTGGNSTIRGLLISGFAAENSRAINLASNGNVVKGNFIGTDFSGSAVLANSTGISVSGLNNVIGGTAPGERNVISGNTVAGIRASSGGVVVQGNYIGRNAANNGNIGNGRGIHLTTTDSTVGGTDAGVGNVIAGNQTGVDISGAGSVKNQIRGNSIYENSNKAISLSSAKPTYNDPRDPDAGPNMLQNYPVLNFALSSGGSTNVRGTFNSVSNNNFTLEFFSNPTCSALGYGEGRTLLGTASVNTANQSGIVSFDVNFGAAVAPGHFITATATDSDGNTSEFSDCEQVGSSFSTISGRVVDSNNNALANRLVALTGARTHVTTTDREGNYSFPDLPIGNYTVAPDQRNHNFSPQNRTYENLNLDQTNQDFVGTRSRYEITAVVKTNNNGSFFALSEVTLTLSGAANQTGQTDANGRTIFNLSPSGNYVVTPSFADYTFTPPSLTLPNPLTSDLTIEFIAQPPAPLAGRLMYTDGRYIKSKNADGSGSVVVSTGNSFSDPRADLSRDGSLLAILDTFTGIWAANFDGSSLNELLDVSGIKTEPRWSPDKTKIAFDERTASNDQGLRIFDVAGGTVSNLNSNGLSPSWSPDGAKIVFEKYLSGNNRSIFSVNSNGASPTQLTSQFEDSYPDWSPDGSKIVFVRKISATSYSIRVMNADGSGQTNIFTSSLRLSNSRWSPDGSRIAFLEQIEDGVWSNTYKLSLIKADGSGRIDLSSSINHRSLSWGAEYQAATPGGVGVAVQAGGVSLNFTGVSNGGQTTVTPISPNSAGTVQGGFVIGNLAYEISTTASYTAPISVCFTVPQSAASTDAQFNALNLMHNENGILVNRTTSRNSISRQICGSVNNLSPFALAEEIDMTKPQISGLVLDSNGNPMSGVRMFLTGEETKETETDTDGSFRFVNLTPGANYNVQPKQLGYIFNSYSQDFVNLSGEQTVVFSGTAAGFAISGQVTDSNGNAISNVTVQLNHGTIAETLTDADGNYTFPNLPADGSYTVRVFDDVNSFSPEESIIEPLLNDVTAVDFMSLPVLSANVSVGGRVMTASGQGIRNVYVTLTEQSGTVHTALTGSFGYYRFDKISVGQIIVVRVFSKRFRFSTPTQVLNVSDIVENLNFTADIQ